jgi:hypothetical protein
MSEIERWQGWFAAVVAFCVMMAIGEYYWQRVNAQPPLYSFGLTVSWPPKPALHAVVSAATMQECEWLKERAYLLRLKEMAPGTYGDDRTIQMIHATPACRVGP